MRLGELSKEARKLTGTVNCECNLARCWAELGPCDKSLELPEGHTIDLGPREYIRIYNGGPCSNDNEFDELIRVVKTSPRLGYAVFRGRFD